MRAMLGILVGLVVGFGAAAWFYGNGGAIIVAGHAIGPVNWVNAIGNPLPAGATGNPGGGQFTGGSGCGGSVPCIPPPQVTKTPGNSSNPPAPANTSVPPGAANSFNPARNEAPSGSSGNSLVKQSAPWLYIVWPRM